MIKFELGLKWLNQVVYAEICSLKTGERSWSWIWERGFFYFVRTYNNVLLLGRRLARIFARDDGANCLARRIRICRLFLATLGFGAVLALIRKLHTSSFIYLNHDIWSNAINANGSQPYKVQHKLTHFDEQSCVKEEKKWTSYFFTVSYSSPPPPKWRTRWQWTCWRNC